MRNLQNSQNFIKRRSLVKELLEATNINTDDLVVEIGPGKGVITEELVTRARQVIAVEADGELGSRLLSFPNQGNLQVVIADFLSWQLPEERYKIFANIPFNLTTDIVNKITSPPREVDDAYLILQKAAAYMFAGQPYHKESLKSVKLGVKFDIKILRDIERTEFSPTPSVNISFIHFHKRNSPLVAPSSLQDFYDFVAYGYTQWQPTVLDAFKKVFSHTQRKKLEQGFTFAMLKPTDLSLKQWIDLFDIYLRYVDTRKRVLVKGSEQRLKVQQARIEKRYRTRAKS